MNDLTLLQQLVARLKAKSPKIFSVITWISTIAMFITGIPELLQVLGVTMPDFAAPLANKAIAIAAFVVMLISKLTVDTPDATADVLNKTATK